MAAGPRRWPRTRRRDGRRQVTYAGRSLYYYVGDLSPGQILCQNVDEFGGRIDLLLGNSMGGMLGFYVAGRHPSAVGRLAVVAAAS